MIFVDYETRQAVTNSAGWQLEISYLDEVYRMKFSAGCLLRHHIVCLVYRKLTWRNRNEPF